MHTQLYNIIILLSIESLNIQEQIRSLYPEIEMASGPLGSAIGVHAGAGTIALTWFRESI